MFSIKKITNSFGVITTTCLLTCAPQFVDASWTTPVVVSDTNSDQAYVAVDTSGNAVAVWQGYDGTNYIIQTSSLPVSGSWSTPITLSGSGQDAQSPAVAVDSSGDAIVIWSRYDGEYSRIQGAQLPLGGSWSTVTDISITGGNADSPALAADYSGTNGSAVAVWHRYNGENFIVQAAELPDGGSWSYPYDISPSGEDALIPAVAVDPNGDAASTCVRYNGENFNTRSATMLAGQEWGASFLLSSPSASVAASSISMDGSGNAIAIWSQFDGSNYIVYSSTVPYGESNTSPVVLSESGGDAFIPMVAMNLEGDAVAVWVRFNGSNFIAQGTTQAFGDSWTTPVDLSFTGLNVANIRVALDQTGNAVAVWDESDGVTSVVNASVYSSSTTTWASPVMISTPDIYAYAPVVGIDGSGNAVALWLESNDGITFYVCASSATFGE